MRQIDINITKAQIISFSVELKEQRPEVSATIGLFTESGKQITSYQIMTNHWTDTFRFELPIQMVEPILKIMKQLEDVVVDHCKHQQKLLGEE